MMIKVFVVDDSSFFRRRITEFLSSHPEIEVIDYAVDGIEAVDKVRKLKPDIITMDIEMPRMNGIDAVKQIRKFSNTPILMFSTLTEEGAAATFDALNAGASDFLPKKFDEIAKERNEIITTLCDRVISLAKKGKMSTAPKVPDVLKRVSSTSMSAYQLAVIGASTGGPIAIEKVLKTLPASFPIPIVLIQHMPASFTGAFAERLNRMCAVNVVEAKDGDVLKNGVVYIAPGGRQMRLKRNRRENVLVVNDDPPQTTYRPSVDITFESIASEYTGRVLAIILTGMGNDGCEGARALRAKGASVWAQDEETSVVYGMPMHIVKANLADKVMSVDEIGTSLARH